MQQLKIWIAIKQRTNLELNEPVLEMNHCERTHTLTTTTTCSKNSQKGVNSQVDYKNNNALPPPPKGLSFTDLRTQMMSSVLYTLSYNHTQFKRG